MIINKDRFYIIAGIFTSLMVFAVNSYPIFEGDLFWHIKTGEWILQNYSLPHSDPFSFTTYLLGGKQDPSRVEFVLSSYWLGQVILYLLWKLGGSTMIVIARALSYAGIIAVLFIWIGRSSKGVLAVAGILAVASELFNFSGERPQLFGYILFLLMLYVIEHTRLQKRISVFSWTLPAVMCIWSNIHGSFLLGDVAIVIYMISYLASNYRSINFKSGYIPLLAASIFASAINPNHFLALGEFFKHYQLGITSSTTEYASPLIKYNIHIGFLSIAAFVILLVLVKWKHIAWEHFLLLFFLAAISLYNGRYIPFFLLSIPLAYTYLNGVAATWLQRSSILILLVIWTFTRTWQGSFSFGVDPMYPEESVKFLNEAAPRGPLFNFVNWGGYVMFFSKYSVFCDGRYLAPKARGFHDDILNKPYGRWLLDKFNISTVLIPGTNAYANDQDHGKPWPLLIQLAQDDRWQLVHYDNVAVVFVRNIPENLQLIQKHRLSKNMIIKHIEMRQRTLAPRGL